MPDETPTRLLNEATNTLHRPAATTSRNTSECGALRRVTDDQITVIEESETALEQDRNIARCGRCFDDGRGY